MIVGHRIQDTTRAALVNRLVSKFGPRVWFDSISEDEIRFSLGGKQFLFEHGSLYCDDPRWRLWLGNILNGLVRDDNGVAIAPPNHEYDDKTRLHA